MKHLLILAISCFVISEIQACKCQHSHIIVDIEKSEQIFIGTVIEASQSPFDGEATIQVKKSWRGEFKKNRISLTGSGNCSYGFQEGKKYLVFANKGRTSICKNNRLLEDARQEMEAMALVDYYKKVPVTKNSMINDQPLLSKYDIAYMKVKDKVTELDEFVGGRVAFIVADTLAVKSDWHRSRGGMNEKSYVIKLTEEEQEKLGVKLLLVRGSLRPLEYIQEEKMKLFRKLKRDT